MAGLLRGGGGHQIYLPLTQGVKGGIGRGERAHLDLDRQFALQSSQVIRGKSFKAIVFTKDAVRRQGITGHADYQRLLLIEPGPLNIVGLDFNVIQLLSRGGL